MALSLFSNDFFNDPFFGMALQPRVSGVRDHIVRGFGAVDLRENDDSYSVEMDTPGLDVENIKVEVEDNLLTISGERTADRGEEGSNYFERSVGKFRRSFRMMDNVDTNNLSASMDRGVLKVTIPKVEPEEPRVRSIPITSNSN